jgi:hypothetical protein
MMASPLQPFEPIAGIARQMLVTGFPADAELLAQLRHGKARTLRQHHKSNNLFHGVTFFQGIMPKIVTNHPGSFVTYLAGS